MIRMCNESILECSTHRIYCDRESGHRGNHIHISHGIGNDFTREIKIEWESK